jgi:flavin reductase (DIM6/NTAB) family NADH-FMN oxidoreductase RutF
MSQPNFAQIDSIFRLIDRAVWIVTSADNDRRSGLVATWVNQCSLDPREPCVLAGLAANHFTTALVEASGAFCLHLIASDQIDIAWRFGLSSGRDRDKFAGIETLSTESGSPLLARCLAWLDCRVVARYDTGDRIYFWADVLAGDRSGTGIPLTEHGLLAAADAGQKAALRDSMAADQELQRPLRQQWRARLQKGPGA